jgi:type IV pilus assembly protein PilM
VLVDIRRKFNLEFIRASLPEEKAYVFRMDVPLLTPDEVREHIAFELEEHVPLPLGDAVFDYQEVPGASKGGETRAVTVSVFPRKTVEAYTTMYLSAGLIPLGFEMEGDAMARAVVRKGDYGTYLLVDFGTERTGISIVSQGAVEFSSTVDIGGATLTAAIQKYFSISMEEAEKIKQEGRFARTGKDQDLFASLMNSVSALRDEINKHVNYWQTRPAQDGDPVKPIEKIILCGGDSNLSGFPEHLALTVTIPVELADVWVNTTALGPYVPPIRFNESLSYTAAIGLALAAR